MNLADWLAEKRTSEWKFYIKRLSLNDTGGTGAHQSGVYIPKLVMREIFPGIQSTLVRNPDHHLTNIVDSHLLEPQELRAIYYNNKFFGKSRDEQRITRWKTGMEYTPVQDPEQTGVLVIFAFHIPSEGANCDLLRTWCCTDLEDEEYIQVIFGQFDPGNHLFIDGDGSVEFHRNVPQTPKPMEFPAEWNEAFPKGREIVKYIIDKFSMANLSADERITKRRNLEFDLFKEVERVHHLQNIKKGFSSVEEFLSLASSISQSRKSRSGNSLEYHLEEIFKEEGLNNFALQCRTEGNKKPDFIFPSKEKYHDSNFLDEDLDMLGVKTTLKDRWRQILNEADRVASPWLFTLQEGLSVNQFEEMKGHNVRLVVPKSIHKSFPDDVKSEIYTLEEFIKKNA